MATEDDVATGLLDWINSFDIAEPVTSVQNLSDGETLWKILQQIDGFSFPGSLPEPPEPSSPTNSSSTETEWIWKWNNLKHLYDALTLFLIEECDQRLPLFVVSAGGRTRPDLKAIAQHSSLPDTILLLKLCVVAAINCADRIEFLKRMQELEDSTQAVLMTTAQEAGEGSDGVEDEDEGDNRRESIASNDVEGISAFTPNTSVPLESDLASEERLGKVIADNQRIALEKREVQRQLDDLRHRHEKLQQRNDRTQEELSETNDRLTALLSGKGEGAQSKAADQKSDTIIATLESRVLAAENEVEELRKSNEVLRIKADRTQKLQDDYDEIKIDRDRLSRKANTAEKYRQKLESIQDMEKENQTLKTKVGELQTQIKQSDSSQASSSNLQREIDEYRRLLPAIEQERYDLNEMKKRLEFDYHTLEARYQDLHDQLHRSQNQVEDLQGRLRDYEDGITPSTPPRQDHYEQPKDWEKEEADFAEAEARLTAALLESSSAENKDKDGKDGKDGADKDENENGVSEDELRAIMSAMRAQAQAGTASEKEVGMRAQKKLLIVVEKQRTRNVALVEHVKKQTDLISQLRQDIEDEIKRKVDQDHTAPAPPPAPQPDQERRQPLPQDESRIQQVIDTNENLKREIRLITSAWYEQNQRLASLNFAAGGSAVLMMRNKMSGNAGGIEEPRSFLGQQRKIVDSVVLGSGVKASRG